MRQAELGNDKILSLVHWGMYSGHGKLEFVWRSLIWTWTSHMLEGLGVLLDRSTLSRDNKLMWSIFETKWPLQTESWIFLLKDYLHRFEHSQM
jgi:hypothetical protein